MGKQIKGLCSTLRRVRDDLGKRDEEANITPETGEGVKRQNIVDEISKALRSQRMEVDPPLNASKAYLADSNGTFGLEFNSDDDDSEVPDWAEDIMKDLSSRVQGKESYPPESQRPPAPFVGLCNGETKKSISVDPPFVEPVPARPT